MLDRNLRFGPLAVPVRSCLRTLVDMAGPGRRAHHRGCAVSRFIVPLLLAAGLLAPLFPRIALGQSGICPGTAMPLDTSARWRPFVKMRLGGREGYFILDTGATHSTLDARTFGRPAGSKLAVSGPSFPSLRGIDLAVIDFADAPAPGGRMAGQIGEDVLAHQTVEMHYDASPPYVVVSPPCPPRKLASAGYASISQQGYFSSNPDRLPPNSPNVPVIYVRIGSVTAPVVIDTGFEENPATRRGIVMINDALFQQLRAARISMQPAGTETTFDCQRRRIEQPLWQVLDVPLVFSTRDGEPIAQYGAPMLLVKAASSCGDIAGVPSALGLIGAIYVARWGVTIFDGPNERVWIRRDHDLAHPPPLYRALAIAWTKTGSWHVEGGETVENASGSALSACNAKFGECTLGVSVDPHRFLCVALARNMRESSKLAYATRPALQDARDAAVELCSDHYGGSCKMEFSYCND